MIIAVVAQSVWRWATVWTIGVLEFDSRRGMGIFLFPTVSRTALLPTYSPIQWVPGSLSLGLKLPESESGHPHQSSSEVEEWVELYLHSPITPSWRCAPLKKKHRDNSTFTLIQKHMLHEWKLTFMEFVCMWSPCEHMFSMRLWTYVQYEILRRHWLAVNEPQICQICQATCRLYCLQQ
jgi:hypothetical protein